MSDIKQTYDIAASPAEVWRALTEPRIIEEWSGARANFPLEVGAQYSLWDGRFVGEVVVIEPNQRLAQTWKPQHWTRTDSIVTFTLTPHGKGTRVDLVHVNVEASDYEGTNEGWDAHYLGAIKRMFEAKPAKTRNAKTTKGTKAAKKPVKRVAVKRIAAKETKRLAKKKMSNSKKSRR